MVKQEESNGFTKQRIDWAMANQKGMDSFCRSSYYVLLAIQYDHFPLIITLANSTEANKKKPFIFIYEAA